MHFSHFLLLLLVSINNCFALFSKGEENEKLKLQLIIAIIIFCLILLLLLLFLVTFLYCKLRTFEREHKMVLFTPIKKKKSSSNDFEKCSMNHKRLGTGFKTSSSHCIKTTSVEKVSPECILTHEHQQCYEYQQCGSCQSACTGRKINPSSSSSITHICEEREALLNGRHLGTDLNDSS